MEDYIFGERRDYDKVMFRVWPDATVQRVEDGPPHSHMSDDYATVWAYDEEDALEFAGVCEHWTKRNLRLRKQFSAPIRFLLWVGLVNIKNSFPAPGTKPGIRWPFRAPPAWAFRSWRDFRAVCKTFGYVYRFRNLPGVIKWLPGRLLPKRWGFGICGFEFGDRG